MTIVAPWAYSKLKKFETCPKQYYHTVITKEYKEPSSDAMMYGNEFHKAAELYIGSRVPIPSRFGFAKPMLDALLDKTGIKHCELKLGLTENLEPCGFFDRDIWFRGVVDLLIIDGEDAYVVDYKTGSNTKWADTGQLELMAMFVFKKFPQVKRIRAGLLFVVAEILIKEVYTIDDAPALWEKWLVRYNRMVAAAEADVWNPRPSGLCRKHCIVLSCPHNGRS
jgi:hypothetical protein